MGLAIIGLMIASATVSFSQDEYDDMYFTPSDRKEVKFNQEVVKNNLSKGNTDAIAKNTQAGDVINPTYSPNDYGDLNDNYSTKNVNPEYIARYKNNPKDASEGDELAEGDSYYDEYYDRTTMPGEEGKNIKKKNYAYPSSYYGGYNAMMRTRMYRNPWYDPFMGGGFGPSWSLGLGYTFGYMPGFSMGFGYGTGYNPYGFYDPFSPFGNPYYMSRYYDPFYSPWGYDPFYDPWGYNSFYSMRYGYGGYPYNCYPSYGFYSGYTVNYVTTSGSKVVTKGNESNRLETPAYRTRTSRGSERLVRDSQSGANARVVSTRRNSNDDSQAAANARIANSRDFSRTQNEYYSRSRSTSSSVAANYMDRNASTSMTSGSSRISSGNTTRVRSARTNANYVRPTYQSVKEQRSISTGRSSGSNWSNTGTYRSSRSSGSSYTPSRSSGSSFGSSGTSIGSSSSGSRSSSSGSYSSGGSRSSGSSGASRSGRGN